MKKYLMTLTVLLFTCGALSIASIVSANDNIPGGPGKPPVFVKFFEKLNYGDAPVELIRNGPVYVEASCENNGNRPRMRGKTDLPGTLAVCTQDAINFYPNGTGAPGAYLDPGDACVIHNSIIDNDPLFRADTPGTILMAPTGEVIQIPATTTGLGVHVLGADCIFTGVATLYTVSP